jgi:hypothetical protein
MSLEIKSLTAILGLLHLAEGFAFTLTFAAQRYRVQ